MNQGTQRDSWPPQEPDRFLRSEWFLNLLTGLAEGLSEDYGAPGAVATVLDWLDRKADGRFFQRFETPAQFVSYLHVALKREARRAEARWRREQRLTRAHIEPDTFPVDAPTAAEELEQREFEEALARTLSGLSEEELVLIHSMLTSASNRDGARKMRLPESTYRKRLNKLLERLLDKLSGFGD